MMRIMTIYGTRPEAIKVAPLIHALNKDPRFESIPVVTGQHREMLDGVNQVFGITPRHDLDVFAPGQGLNQLMSKVFAGLDPVLAGEGPAAVVVQGDTSTVAAAAIAAYYRDIPVVHLEAGLRSGNLWSPFPEEGNRKITTQVTSLHLAPTHRAKANLLREAVAESEIAVTGNTVIDALLMTSDHPQPLTDPRLREAVESGRPLLLVTTHRRENWGDAMQGVGKALRRLAQRYPELVIVLPAHRNPIVRGSILPHLEGADNVVVTEPLPYGQFTRVMAAARVVLTDSGGVQEEAPSLGTPVLVMRDTTERPEAVDAGTVRLIGTDENRIVDEVARLLDDPASYREMATAVNPYGDGKAARRCVAAIAALLGLGHRLPDFQSR
ncbi:MAG: non-hydrolyzing UDP-N-acetylglucosamine 2-epimerase [Arachnia sp.]